MLRHLGKIVAATAVTCVLIQFYPMERINPPASHEIAAPPSIETILERACADCHSNHTRWPWYAHVAPLSWLVVRDVEQGRQHLNFSTWDKYADDPETEITKLRNIDKVMHDRSMPQWYYLLGHPSARLTDADRDEIEKWVSGSITRLKQHQQGEQ